MLADGQADFCALLLILCTIHGLKGDQIARKEIKYVRQLFLCNAKPSVLNLELYESLYWRGLSCLILALGGLWLRNHAFDMKLYGPALGEFL